MILSWRGGLLLQGRGDGRDDFRAVRGVAVSFGGGGDTLLPMIFSAPKQPPGRYVPVGGGARQLHTFANPI